MRKARKSRIAASLCGLLLISLSMPACDRRIEPYDPAEKSAQPDLAHIFPAREPAAAAAAGGAMPAAATGPARAASDQASGKTLRSRVTRGAGAEAPPGAVLFVIARHAGSAGGPPLAVQRIADPRFPVDFEIGAAQVMIPSMRFEGPIDLSVRLDADGNAMSREAGNLQARSEAPLSPGSDGVELVLAP